MNRRWAGMAFWDTMNFPTSTLFTIIGTMVSPLLGVNKPDHGYFHAAIDHDSVRSIQQDAIVPLPGFEIERIVANTMVTPSQPPRAM